MKFTCDFCGKKGNLLYCCVQYDFAIHSCCAACPRRLKVYHHNYPLHLTPSLEVHQSDSPICLLCVRKVDTLYLYYCSSCDFVYINLEELKEDDPELHQSIDTEICEVKKTVLGEDETKIATEIKHFSHEHNLKLIVKILNNTKCNSCKECRGQYIHHKSCAELPLGLHHPSHPNHPLIIFDPCTYRDNNREEYDKFSKCNICGQQTNEYSHCYYWCNFIIHSRCSSLSLTIQTKVRDHQLTRIWKLMKFTCDFYGKKGNLLYCCVQYDFAIHSCCAACPRRLKVYHHNYPLHLTPSLEVHQSDSPICLLCVRKVDTLYLYYCSSCDFVYINLEELKEDDPELHQSIDTEICEVKKTVLGEDETKIATEIKHFSHEHNLKLIVKILNNTKCNREYFVVPLVNLLWTSNALHYHKPHGTTNMNIPSLFVILLKMTPVNITMISVKKNEIPSNGFTTVKIAIFLLIGIAFLGRTKCQVTHIMATY
ncbi:hypothetical protein CFP56_028018 [Quercus suber]|uniref:DC1 domain-containing protein n=1 Tax=Quercus suber TaxID=58331 RepID=A0AAW0JUN3_QUESU